MRFSKSDTFVYHFHLGFLIKEFEEGCSIWTCFPCNGGRGVLPDTKVSHHWYQSVETCKLVIELDLLNGSLGTYHPPLERVAGLTLAEAQKAYSAPPWDQYAQ